MSGLLQNRVGKEEAEVIRRYMSSVPVKVGALAKELGLAVTRTPMLPKFSGLIKPSGAAPAGFEICVNKYEPTERQRFTVAHEIAHYLLHREDIGPGVVDSVMYRSTLTSRKETEANQLAADIIMPAKLVVEELERLGGKKTDDVIEKLAAAFKVSVPAMRIRLGGV